MISKDDAIIDWNLSADTVHDRIRGLSPWPVARTVFNGKIFKIYSSRVCEHYTSGEPGDVKTENGEIYVVCGGNTCLKLCEVQLEGSKRMNTVDFLRGRQFPQKYNFVKDN